MRKYLTINTELYNMLNTANQISLSELNKSSGTITNYTCEYSYTNKPIILRRTNSIIVLSSELEIIFYNIKFTERALTKLLECHPEYTFLHSQEGKVFRTHAAVLYKHDIYLGDSHEQIISKLGTDLDLDF